MAKGGSSQPVKQEITQSTLPEYARPYFEGLMTRANANLTGPYIPYGYTQDKTTGEVVKALDAQGNPINPQRIADFTQQQQDLQKNILSQQTPGQFGAATGIASDVANRSIAAGQYNPGQFGAQQIGMPNLQQYSMQGPANVQAQQVAAQDMQAAQSGYNPNLNYFQMRGPQQFGSTQAQQYMSPFIQQALEPQMREAITSARRGQVAQDLGSSRQGTYGGSRQLLASMERERNLGQQLGDIQSRGLQSAYESAQQQFERDRAAGMTTAQQNQAAALQTQQLGTQTGLQVALANLSNEQQARVNNQAQQFQAQGMNAENALRAALANQQTGLQVGQQNLSAALDTQRLGTQTGLAALQANQQADLDRQRMAEQSRQFGSSQGLAGLAQAGQMGQTLANIGSAQSQADQARFGLQTSTAAQQQALNQQYLDTDYQEFLRQRDYPLEQLQQYSSLLRGVPVTPNSTSTTYAPNASLGSQLMGGGLAAAGIYNTANRAGLI
jgi:hypothetical protein